MLYTGILLGHHILMSLEHHHRSVFATGRGGNTHHHIADGVGFGFYIMTFRPVEQKSLHFVKMMRRTRHLGNFVKCLPYQRRLQFCDFHGIYCFLKFAYALAMRV